MAKAVFEWDDDKDAANQIKHGVSFEGVSFETAQRAFDDPCHAIMRDLGHERGEKRFYCFGMVESTMKKKTTYTDEPMLVGERVVNLLPPPSQLVKRKSTVKITLEITQGSLNFFKKQAMRQHVPYQRMLRELIDAYAACHAMPGAGSGTRGRP